MGASPSDASGVRVARRASRVTRDMLDGERGTFRFGFGGAEEDDDDAEDERRDGKRARAEDRAAEEIDASSLECDDEATWQGIYETHGDVEIVRGAHGSTASTLDGCPEEADVVPGVYEGGLKSWECADDLATYIATDDAFAAEMAKMKSDELHVLELGAGQAVPGLVAMRKLSGRCESVTLTDYNRDVVEEVTVPNAQATMALMESEKEKVPSKVRFLCGGWSGYDAFVEKGSVDVLLTSESIYDVGQYDNLCRFIAHALREKTGACYVAAKSYYFGVGGGTNAFTTYCRKYFDLEVESLKTFSDGSSNVRELLLVRRK
jgi:hypothetical protein